ncbi:MAG: F0F1 ATP synthase subunit B' [Methylocystis sp.]|nr:F0F1 ATP synthase subunit B' [Methylocystis sp.]MCA3582530.1 F0F1 ATP synthase subunit B' [Methylocystis sp.]MCA3589425.1 F0F1 ATP synthase subunit B' [Methylocystis sp.]MCA3591089.1 F0F1 ATP synthase subunit B' [Methylocystis sp.]
MLSLLIGTAHAAETAVAEGAVKFPPFDATTFAGQIFWLAITFGFLYYLMSKIALPRVSEILETREGKIDGDLQTASAMQEKAKAAGEAYEKLLADARAGAQATAQKARDAANSAAEAKRKEVEAETARKIAASEVSIAAARDKAMTNVAGIASDTAVDIVKRITGIAPKADDLKRAIEAAKA